MYLNELSFQAHSNHKFNQYRQEADTERLLRISSPTLIALRSGINLSRNQASTHLEAALRPNEQQPA